MITIRDKVLNVSIWEILEEMKIQMSLKGIMKLKDVIHKGDNARITCPSHKEGMERNPSCSILLEEKFDKNRNILEEGTVSCFTCGYRANLVQFVAICFDQSETWAENWLLETFDNTYYERGQINYQLLPLNYNEAAKPIIKKREYISEDILEQLRYYHPYMWTRKLTPEIVSKFDIGYNKYKNTITFPVYDDKGCILIIERYIDYKRFDIPENAEKVIFGLNHITEDIGSVIICESVINALTCWVYGKPAIALFGTGSSEQIDTLLKTNIRHFILGFDGDNAGYNATIKFKKAFKNSGKLITQFKIPKDKDINDLSYEEFNCILKQI